MTNSVDETIERVVQRYCKSVNKPQTTKNDRPVCGMCHKNDKKELITCSSCAMSGHSDCLGCSETFLKRIKELPNWECPNCRTCPFCGKNDDETNIVCVICDRTFHRACLRMNTTNSGKCLFFQKKKKFK